MDQLAGVDFKKGCFVGQEVVARMQHRGTARTRIVATEYDGATPESGVALMAGEKNLGTFGSGANGRGIALVRIDRVADALAAGTSIEAGGVPMKIVKPAWAQFTISDPTKATG
jgi:folate-binding Fe-S cluster repair protein YgfZ